MDFLCTKNKNTTAKIQSNGISKTSQYNFGTWQILSAVEQNKSEPNLDFRVGITEPIPAGMSLFID